MGAGAGLGLGARSGDDGRDEGGPCRSLWRNVPRRVAWGTSASTLAEAARSDAWRSAGVFALGASMRGSGDADFAAGDGGDFTRARSDRTGPFAGPWPGRRGPLFLFAAMGPHPLHWVCEITS